MGIDAEMFVKTKKVHSEDEVLRLAYRICEAFGHKRFLISKDSTFGPHHALSIIDEYEQDGDTLYPENDEQFIRVHLCTRYYGIGYERGDLPLLISIAEWLEINIPGEVWYGGDSSGVIAEPFNRNVRDELFRHFAACGHSPYRAGWNSIGDGGSQYCEFCHHDMDQNGFGKNYMAFICFGCGERRAYRDGVLVNEDKS